MVIATAVCVIIDVLIPKFSTCGGFELFYGKLGVETFVGFDVLQRYVVIEDRLPVWESEAGQL